MIIVSWVRNRTVNKSIVWFVKDKKSNLGKNRIRTNGFRISSIYQWAMLPPRLCEYFSNKCYTWKIKSLSQNEAKCTMVFIEHFIQTLKSSISSDTNASKLDHQFVSMAIGYDYMIGVSSWSSSDRLLYVLICYFLLWSHSLCRYKDGQGSVRHTTQFLHIITSIHADPSYYGQECKTIIKTTE